jgi:transcriptional regulator with XRE-family HTH domain
MNNARQIRDQRGLRIEVVAAQAGLSLLTVRKVECGKSTNSNTLVKLADYYGVTLDQLTGRAPLPEQQKEAA